MTRRIVREERAFLLQHTNQLSPAAAINGGLVVAAITMQSLSVAEPPDVHTELSVCICLASIACDEKHVALAVIVR